jgi:hypothetical protein
MSFRNRDIQKSRAESRGSRARGNRRRPRARSSRRGVLLLVVLSLLVLFMLIGTAFLMSSNQYRHAAKASARNARLGTPPTKLLDRALMQVLCDTGNQNSVLRYHSLLRDLYGSEGFQAEVYQPRVINTAATAPPVNQATRFAAATTGSAAQQLGPTQGQLVDIYVKVLTFGQNDPLTTIDESTLVVPDTRHALTLEPNVNGQPQAHPLPLTKGYYNGCLLTMTSGPAAGQSTRIVDYEFLGDLNTATRLFRFRVMAFPRSDGAPLTIDAAYPPEIKDLVIPAVGARTSNATVLRGQTFIVNGRPFNGTGAGFNELAKAGEPRLDAVDVVINPGSPDDPQTTLFPEVALTPNSAFTLVSDPVTTGNDLMGVGYLAVPGDKTSWMPLNPKSIAAANRPTLWKYQTFVGPGDADESYDAPDFQNMFLALQTVTPRSRGRVVQEVPVNPTTLEVDDAGVNSGSFLRLDLEDLPIPSYHRPDLINFWFHRLIQINSGSADQRAQAVLAPYGPDCIRGNSDDPGGVPLATRDQIVNMKRKFIMRPLREDHPNFDGSNPASRPQIYSAPLQRSENIAVPYWEAVGPWDVDNDNDGVPDSIWVDLGDPVAQAEDGTLYKPLYAMLIVDLDSRLNVNAHGLVDDLTAPLLDASLALGGNLAHDLSARSDGIDNDGDSLVDEADEARTFTSNLLPSGLGYGPAEISLRPLLSPNLPGNPTYGANIGNPGLANLHNANGVALNADDYARILIGRTGDGAVPSTWGRHGFDPAPLLANQFPYKAAPGITSTSQTGPQIAPPSIATQFKFVGYPWLVFDYSAAAAVRSAFGSPPDLMGRYAIGLDHTGQPVNELTGESANRPLLANAPYELDLSGDRRREVRTDGLTMRLDVATGATEYYLPGATAPASTTPGIAKESDDAAFATADLERILRAYDADAGILPGRLWNVVDAFDPLKLFNGQPAAVNAQAFASFGSTNSAQQLAAAQQLASINRRLVTTDSYDLPVASTSMLGRLTYGADGLPGVGGADDDGDGTPENARELGWKGSDDWYAVMYHETPNAFNASTGEPTPPAGVRLAPANPTIVELLRYRIQFERRKLGVPLFSEIQLANAAENLLPREILAGGKMDLNRPFGDGRDSGDGIDNNGDGIIDEPSEPGDPYVNGIVDDPIEAGEPFLDANGDGKWNAGEKWVDVDADGNYDPPIDRLWIELTNEPIAFDYTNGQGVLIRPEAFGGPVPLGVGVRNLDAQGRQLYARQLYCMMLLLMDENYLDMPDVPSLLGSNLNQELQRIKIRTDLGLAPFAGADANDIVVRRKLTCQRIAQWAVNCVDFRDADSIMTCFEYDENPWDGWGCPDSKTPTAENIPLDGNSATDENLGYYIDWRNVTPGGGAGTPPTVPIQQVTPASILPTPPNRTRGVVWGAERPELLITETLAFHDRRCTDEQTIDNLSILQTPGPNQMPDFDLDQRLKPRGTLYVELMNPSSPDGNKPAEFYGAVPTSGVPDQGVMLNKLSDQSDSVSGKRSPVWRMSVLREPLSGRMPVFRNPITRRLDSGVMDMSTFVAPDPNDREPLTAAALTIDPDGYGLYMDEHAERQIYFTTGEDYVTPAADGDLNRSDDDNLQASASVLGEWDLSGATPDPVTSQLRVRVPPLPYRIVDIPGNPVKQPMFLAKRYFIARNERETTAVPNDRDITIAPILPGRYAVVGSSGLQVRGMGATTSRTADGQVTDRFVLPISRDASQPEDSNGDAQTFGRLPNMRRIEFWPNLLGRPDFNQVLVAENGGPEFVRINNNLVVNATDPDRNGDPTNTPPDQRLIDPAVAIPVEDLNISEPVEGYPSLTYRKLYEMNTPINSMGSPIPLPTPELRLTDEGDFEYRDINTNAAQPYDRPLDTDFELVRNGTTQNYRSVHLQRLANPALPWNPLPQNADGTPNRAHRPWLPVNPYRTIDSQSVDMTAYNGASTLERTNLPVAHTSFSRDLTNDLLQSNIIAPITATQFLEIPIGNTPAELRGAGAADINNIENPLRDLEDIEPAVRSILTETLNETPVPPRQAKYPTGMQQGWSWHMYRRVLPDDQVAGASPNSFRQWLHFKSLERGFHTSNYFKYPKPGASYASINGNPAEVPANVEGWAPFGNRSGRTRDSSCKGIRLRRLSMRPI